jgi:gluconate 2-dehydrogenase gamma chain
MPDPFDDDQRALVGRALDALVPGAAALGAVDYVEQLLTALDHDPPRIWAGRDGWLELGPWERHAWELRLETLRAVYRRVIDDTPEPGDAAVLHAHACEAAYGDPAYGGNRDIGGWVRIGFPEPLFPPARSGT